MKREVIWGFGLLGGVLAIAMLRRPEEVHEEEQEEDNEQPPRPVQKPALKPVPKATPKPVQAAPKPVEIVQPSAPVIPRFPASEWVAFYAASGPIADRRDILTPTLNAMGAGNYFTEKFGEGWVTYSKDRDGQIRTYKRGV